MVKQDKNRNNVRAIAMHEIQYVRSVFGCISWNSFNSFAMHPETKEHARRLRLPDNTS